MVVQGKLGDRLIECWEHCSEDILLVTNGRGYRSFKLRAQVLLEGRVRHR